MAVAEALTAVSGSDALLVLDRQSSISIIPLLELYLTPCFGEAGIQSMTGAPRLHYLTKTNVSRMVRGLPDDFPSTRLGLQILAHYLGDDWIKQHIGSSGGQDFLRLPATADLEPDRLLAEEEKQYRIINLAEMLFNLQFNDGFKNVIDRLSAASIADTFAELETATLLYDMQIPFRFVAPRGQLGLDYDLELQLRCGTWVCADTKNKAHGSIPSQKGVLNSLDRGRRQVPDDRPSFLFLRVPSDWLSPDHYPIVEAGIRGFFSKGNGRIASVKVHTRAIRFVSDSFCVHWLPLNEHHNPRCRFQSPESGWNLAPSNASPRPRPSRLVTIPWFVYGREQSSTLRRLKQALG